MKKTRLELKKQRSSIFKLKATGASAMMQAVKRTMIRRPVAPIVPKRLRKDDSLSESSMPPGSICNIVEENSDDLKLSGAPSINDVSITHSIVMPKRKPPTKRKSSFFNFARPLKKGMNRRTTQVDLNIFNAAKITRKPERDSSQNALQSLLLPPSPRRMEARSVGARLS